MTSPEKLLAYHANSRPGRFNSRSLRLVAVCAIAAAAWLATAPALSNAQIPLGTAFTYQGQLKNNGSPVGPTAILQFSLWNDPIATAPANQLGSTIFMGAVPLTNGLFTVKLNTTAEFGLAPFDGSKRWLEIAVNGTTLSPRQEFTAAPYAQYAEFSAKPWSTSAADTYFSGGNVAVGTSTILGTRRFEANASSINATAVYAENNTPPGGFSSLYVTNQGGGLAARIQDGDVVVINGSVGIGTISPSKKLHVVGDICVTGIVGVCSDSRFKTHVKSLDDGLSLVEKLQPVRFDWNRKEYCDHHFAEGPQVGLIAQEVRQIIPEVVSVGSDGYLSVDYGRLTPILVEAVKEQQQSIGELRRITQQQMTENTQLRAELDEMRLAISEIRSKTAKGKVMQ